MVDAPASPPPAGPAIEAAGTRGALKRSGRVVAAVAALTALVLVVAGAMWSADQATNDLQRTGTRTDATITAVNRTDLGRGRPADGSVELTYEAGGTTETRTLYVGNEVDRFRADQTVTVAYDPSSPEDVQVVGVAPARQGVPTLLVAGVGLLIGLCAGHLFLRVRRLRRLLQAEPWLAVPARLTEVRVSVGRRQRMTTLLWLAPPEGSAVLAQPAGIDRLALSFEPTVWTVRLDQDRFVAAPPGGAPIRWMRRVHGPGH